MQSSDQVLELENIFMLSNYDYDYQEDYYLIGPTITKKEFQELCESLMEQAGRNVLAIEQDYQFVQPSDIMAELIKLLKDKGFKQIRLKNAYFDGSFIGDMNHYKQVTERYDSETPAKAEDKRSIYYHLKNVHKMISEHNQVEYDKMQEARRTAK